MNPWTFIFVYNTIGILNIFKKLLFHFWRRWGLHMALFLRLFGLPWAPFGRPLEHPLPLLRLPWGTLGPATASSMANSAPWMRIRCSRLRPSEPTSCCCVLPGEQMRPHGQNITTQVPPKLTLKFTTYLQMSFFVTKTIRFSTVPIASLGCCEIVQVSSFASPASWII